jgi:hypothetical protein
VNNTFAVPRNAAVPTGKFCRLTPATVDVRTLFMNAIIKNNKLVGKNNYHELWISV